MNFGDVSTRQRIAIVFMVTSLVATLVLGGAVLYELGRKGGSVSVLGTRAGAQGAGANGAVAGDEATVSAGVASLRTAAAIARP